MGYQANIVASVGVHSYLQAVLVAVQKFFRENFAASVEQTFLGLPKMQLVVEG